MFIKTNNQLFESNCKGTQAISQCYAVKCQCHLFKIRFSLTKHLPFVSDFDHSSKTFFFHFISFLFYSVTEKSCDPTIDERGKNSFTAISLQSSPPPFDNKDKIKVSMIFLVGYLATTGLIRFCGLFFPVCLSCSEVMQDASQCRVTTAGFRSFLYLTNLKRWAQFLLLF